MDSFLAALLIKGNWGGEGEEIQIKICQSFEKEDAPASRNEDDREKSADKFEKLENMQCKMLSR
ncbi:R3H domain-containing protein 1-like isoform X1, partial [Tachysurus ichikawai]